MTRSPITRSPILVFVVLLAVTTVLGATALVVGPGDLSFGDVADTLTSGSNVSRVQRALVVDVRLPRVLLALIVGTALGVAGAVTQGLFRNPLAEPGVLGVSSGAATAAVIGFALGIDDAGLWVTPLLAALGAFVVLAALGLLTRSVGAFASLLLSGIALGALCSAVITFVLAMGTERWDLGLKVVRWLMGSFEGRSWSHVFAATPLLAIGLALAAWLRLDLDALQLGNDTARSLGVHLRRTQWLAMLAVGLLVGMATALTGVIGFVGLLVPHLARMWVGPGHRALLPTSAMLGGVLLLSVDTASRSFEQLVLPPGAVTSLLGAPFFLWLLRSMRAEQT